MYVFTHGAGPMTDHLSRVRRASEQSFGCQCRVRPHDTPPTPVHASSGLHHTYPKQKHRPGGAVSCMQGRRRVVEQGTAWLLLMPIIGSRFTLRP